MVRITNREVHLATMQDLILSFVDEFRPAVVSHVVGGPLEVVDEGCDYEAFAIHCLLLSWSAREGVIARLQVTIGDSYRLA